MEVRILNMSADLVEVAIVNKQGRVCLTLHVQETDEKLLVHQSTYEGGDHSNSAFRIPKPNPSLELTADEVAMCRSEPHRIVPPVRSYRNRTGVSLVEARNAVVRYMTAHGIPHNHEIR